MHSRHASPDDVQKADSREPLSDSPDKMKTLLLFLCIALSEAIGRQDWVAVYTYAKSIAGECPVVVPSAADPDRLREELRALRDRLLAGEKEESHGPER